MPAKTLVLRASRPAPERRTTSEQPSTARRASPGAVSLGNVFNLGPFEIAVLVIVALIVFGPDKLPTLAKDAARMIRTLRDLAQGARTQLRDELGPELGDLDLRSLDPRVALKRALFDDDEPPAREPDDSVSDADKPVNRPALRPLGRGEAAPYDGDAT